MLTYRGQLYRLQKLVVAALSHYGFHDAQFALLKYENNAVYSILKSSGERFVLRISAANSYNVAELNSEAQWLMALRNTTCLLVPEPLETRGGSFVITVEAQGIPEPRHCMLFRWIPGKHVTKLENLALVKEMGTFLAHMHQFAQQFVPPPNFVRPCWDWNAFFDAILLHKIGQTMFPLSAQDIALVQAVGAKVSTELATINNMHSWGLIHADMYKENILTYNNQIGAIDFDDCGWGYYLFDVASFLDSVKRSVTANQYIALQNAYLEGYNMIRTLPTNFGSQQNTFTAIRNMGILNFILRSRNPRVQIWGHYRLTQIIENLKFYLE